MPKIVHSICFILLLFFQLRLTAQVNLVPNPSFELVDSCVIIGGAIDTSETSPLGCLNWFTMTKGTPDYFNKDCQKKLNQFYVIPKTGFGYQSPRSGISMIGLSIIPNDSRVQSNAKDYKEYVQVRLTEPLSKDMHYIVNYYTSFANQYTPQAITNTFAVATISMYISIGKIPFIDTTKSLNWIIPQINRPKGQFVTDTVEWTLTRGVYKAKGGEQWITIGDFGIYRDDTLMFQNASQFPISLNTYYFIDDVSIMAIDDGKSIDTIICNSQSIQLSTRQGWDSCIWNDGLTDTLRAFSQQGKYWVTQFYAGFSVTDTFNIQLLDTTQSIVSLIDFCTLDSVLLNARVSNSYVWNTGSTQPFITIGNQGIFYVTLQQGNCLVTDSFYVTEQPLPSLSFLKDTTVCFDQVAQILLDAGQFASYLWKPTGETTRTIYSNTAQVYVLTVTDTNACSTSKQIAVMETCPETVFIPNAFTPDGDGINDVWKITTLSVTQFELSIYNRWGERIFHTTDKTEYWDGNNAPADVYTYVVNYKATGKSLQSIKGTLSVIR